jgi:hypothetical protein
MNKIAGIIILLLLSSCSRNPCDRLTGKWGIRNDTTTITVKIYRIGNQYQVSFTGANGTLGFLSPCNNGILKGNGVEITYSEIGDYISISGISLNREK